MTRLYDRVMAGEALDRGLRDAMRESTVIVGDAVSDYYWAGTEQEEWDVAADFPRLAPPLETMFIEFRAPTHIASSVSGTQEWGDVRPRSWGLLMATGDIAERLRAEATVAQLDAQIEDMARQLAPVFERAAQLGGEDLAAGVAALPWMEQQQVRSFAQLVAGRRSASTEEGAAGLWERMGPEGVRWGVNAVLIAEYATRKMFPVWSWQYLVRGDGSLERASADAWCKQGPVAPHVQELCRREGRHAFEGLADSFAPLLHCALLTISFMHCKNVTLREVDPVAEWRERNPKKKGYSPVLVRYKVLDIEPMKKVLRHEGQSETSGLKRALHICRGHFATYDERPLFGKHRGTFWVPMHVRGTPEAGAVVKDYRVLSPSGKPQRGAGS